VTAALLRKELRAQAALWLVIAVSMVAGTLKLPRGGLREFGPIFYVIGALALGADVMGQEVRHGTLAQLLMHPVRRARTLVTKMAVLAALLIGIGGIAALAVFPQFRWSPSDRDFLVALIVLPLAYGFLVAPWLALTTRSTLAGTLFSGALAALLLLGGSWLGTSRFEAAAEIDAVRLRVLWTGSAVLCVCGAIGIWRSFAGLQVLEGVGGDLSLPGVFGTVREATARRRHPVVLLVAKELRLQQLTFVAPVIYVLVCVAVWGRRQSMPAYQDTIAVATLIHALVVAALAGAFSCAEERVLGTLPWQLLQPMAAGAQFAVKVATTVALTLTLAVGLPAVLVPLLGAAQPVVTDHVAVGALLALLAGSVYVSSVSSSPLIAFFSCIPAFMATFWFVREVAARAGWMIFLRLHTLPHGRFLPMVLGWGALATDAALALIVFAFAFANHRTIGRSTARVAGQVLFVAIAVVVLSATFAAGGRLLFF
jgi:ABC-2 family transporter